MSGSYQRLKAHLPITGGVRWSFLYIPLTIWLLFSSGCAVNQPQDVPHSSLQLFDDSSGRSYFVYLPSSYGKVPLPLVVTCHGTNPWDSAEMQINEWKYLAEKNNMVVIAPKLNSSRGLIPPSQSEGRTLLMGDEAFIVKTVRKFLRHGNIDRRAIMITGWSSGGFAAYFTGLRNPNLFRVVVARQSNYIREYYDPDKNRFDPYQPVCIFYGQSDAAILQADAHVAYKELRGAGLKNLVLEKVPGGHYRRPEVAIKFFLNALKIYPRPFILSARLDKKGQCMIQFDSGLMGRIDDEKVFWSFGDGSTARGTKIRHLYRNAGKYRLVLLHVLNKTEEKFVGIVSITPSGIEVRPGDYK